MGGPTRKLTEEEKEWYRRRKNGLDKLRSIRCGVDERDLVTIFNCLKVGRNQPLTHKEIADRCLSSGTFHRRFNENTVKTCLHTMHIDFLYPIGTDGNGSFAFGTIHDIQHTIDYFKKRGWDTNQKKEGERWRTVTTPRFEAFSLVKPLSVEPEPYHVKYVRQHYGFKVTYSDNCVTRTIKRRTSKAKAKAKAKKEYKLKSKNNHVFTEQIAMDGAIEMYHSLCMAMEEAGGAISQDLLDQPLKSVLTRLGPNYIRFTYEGNNAQTKDQKTS